MALSVRDWSGDAGEDAESFFDAAKAQFIEVNLPGNFYQPPLILSADQEFYTKLSRCPTGIKGKSAGASANFSIAAFGTPDNEAINLFLYSHQPLVVNRALNKPIAGFYSQIDRNERQIAGSNDVPNDGICPVPPETLFVPQQPPLDVAAWWETALGTLDRFNFLPLVAGQDLDFNWENSPGDNDLKL